MSHKFLDHENVATDGYDTSYLGNALPNFFDIVDEVRKQRVWSYDDSSAPVMAYDENDSNYMTSVKPRSTKGPGSAMAGSIKAKPIASIRISSKLSAKISAKMSVKISDQVSEVALKSTKLGEEEDEETRHHKKNDIDFEASRYGAQGRNLPRRRRSTFVL